MEQVSGLDLMSYLRKDIFGPIPRETAQDFGLGRTFPEDRLNHAEQFRKILDAPVDESDFDWPARKVNAIWVDFSASGPGRSINGSSSARQSPIGEAVVGESEVLHLPE